MIAIVNYGMGNLFSIYNALDRIGGIPKSFPIRRAWQEQTASWFRAWGLLEAAWISSADLKVRS